MNSTLCYKDGPQLLPLNFTTLCIGYGRYVIFYNERMPGVSYPSDYQLRNLYTELCEVIVQGNSDPLFYYLMILRQENYLTTSVLSVFFPGDMYLVIFSNLYSYRPTNAVMSFFCFSRLIVYL